MSRYKLQACSMVQSLHLLGCETESKHILNRSNTAFASLIDSWQSTPFSLPPWYAAVDMPKVNKNIFHVGQYWCLRLFFFSLSALKSDFAFVADCLFKVQSASSCFLCFTNSAIAVSNSSCCDFRPLIASESKSLLCSSLLTSTLFTR
jgi:hypothetical protein